MKILLVATAWPWPPRKGHQLRSLQLAELLARDHEVTLFAPGGPPPPPGLAYRIEGYRLNPIAGLAPAVLDDRALQAGLFHSDDLRRRVAALAPGIDLAILQTVRTGGVAGALDGTPLAVDLIDSLSLNFERRARFDKPWLRPILRHEARRLARDERRFVERSCFASLVCPRDRDHVAAALPPGLRARLAVVPLALSGTAIPPERSVARPFRLCITGNLGYFPTAHGAVWLLDEVWPRLRARIPEATLRIAGARPPRRLRAAARRAGAELVADPENLDVELAAASAAAVPLFAGSGVAVKLLEALAAGVPAVTTPWAAAGLEPELGEAVVRAESAEEWVEALAAIHDRPADAERRARELAVAVRRLHAPERVARELRAALSLVPR